jgi:hypothetical protein
LLRIRTLETQEAGLIPFTAFLPSYLAAASFEVVGSTYSFRVASCAITVAFVIEFEYLLLDLHYSFRPFQKL